MKRPATILFVHYGGEAIRGSERVLLDLIRTLDRDRFQPVLWCNAATMADAASEIPDFPAHRSRFSILLDWSPPRYAFLRYARMVREARTLIRQHDVHLIHANSAAPSQWTLPAARAARLPLITHLHAPYVLRDRCTMGLHNVPYVTGVSRVALDGLIADGYPVTRTRVIHNGVDPVRLAAGTPANLRPQLGIPPDCTVVALIGVLVPLKGIDVLLHSAALLADHRPRIHYVIIGDGHERERLAALAVQLGVSDDVHFLGQRSDVGPILRGTVDIVCSASRSEAFGLTLVEAGACERPVVATAVGGVGEVVTHEDNGLLVPPDDPVALANALVRLAGDRELQRRLGQSGRARFESEFTVGAMTNAFEETYEALLARPPQDYGWRGQGVHLTPWVRLVAGAAARRLSKLGRAVSNPTG